MNNARLWPKAKYVMRRDGSLLTLGDLPCAKTKRWVIGRKADVVDAVRVVCLAWKMPACAIR